MFIDPIKWCVAIAMICIVNTITVGSPSLNDEGKQVERFAAKIEGTILENQGRTVGPDRYVIVDELWLEQEGDGPASRALIATLNAKLNGFNADSPTKFYIGLRGIAAVPALQAAPTDGTPSSLDDQLGYLKEGMDRESVETALGYARQLETEHIGGILNRPHVRAGSDILIFTYSRYLAERISADGTVGEVYGLAAHYATPGIAAQGARLRGHYRANREFYDFVDNAERALPEYIEKGIAVLGSPPFDSDPVYAGPCTPEMEAVLLASFADHPWLERDSPLRDMILRSPCILRGTRSTGEGLGYETQWSRDMHRVFGAALWTAFAPLAIEVLGPSLLEQYGARKAREFALGMAIDAGLQVAIAITFGGKDFGEAVSDIDRYQALASGAESLADNVYLSAGVSCLLDGLTEKGQPDGNLSVGRFGRECAMGALSAVLADRLLRGGGRLFTKLRAIARADPLGFGSGLAGLNITGTEEVRRVCGYLELDGATTDRVLSACFVADTPVLMADGSRKPIQTVTVGDLVATFVEPTGATSEGRVVNTFHRTVGRLITVRAGGDLIRATPEHPFHVDGQWVTAQHLKKGDRLRLHNGKELTVEDTERNGSLSTVYNFEVEGHHNYFVGERGILVHNRCLPLPKELLETHGRLSMEIREKLEGWSNEAVEGFLRDVREVPDLLVTVGADLKHMDAWWEMSESGFLKDARTDSEVLRSWLRDFSPFPEESKAFLEHFKRAFPDKGLTKENWEGILIGFNDWTLLRSAKIGNVRYSSAYEFVELKKMENSRGSWKEAFEVIGKDDIILKKFQSDVIKHDNPTDMAKQLTKEVKDLHKIKSAGFRTPEILYFTYHEGVPALVMRKYATSFYPNGKTSRKFRDVATLGTLEEAIGIRDRLISGPIFIEDLQFLISNNGTVLIHDPMDVIERKGPNHLIEIYRDSNSLIEATTHALFEKVLQKGKLYSMDELKGMFRGVLTDTDFRMHMGTFESIVEINGMYTYR